jgi:starch synthase
MGKPISVLFVASEVFPFAKVGGVADIAYSLPLALRDLGHDVRVMLPKYGNVSERKNKIHEINRLRDIPIPVGKSSVIATIKSSSINNLRSKVQAYITTNERYFDSKKGVYFNPKTGKIYPDNHERFIFFCRSVIESCLILEWFPDIIHCNDWHTCIIPAYVKHIFPNKFKKTKIVLTIHNFSNQGEFPIETYSFTGFPEKIKQDFTHNGKFNFLKGGIIHSDIITTVSPSYSKEILQDTPNGNGLNSVLAEHQSKFQGILNGIDPWTWNPEADSLISSKYHGDLEDYKRKNKQKLIEQFNLKSDENIPLIGMITRLDEQKGLSILFEAAEQLFKENIQFILLCDGNPEYKKELKEMAKVSGGKFNYKYGFEEQTAHQIEAGSDIYLIPSLYEPCGLNSLFSLTYGTVPIARATGGLIDIVENYDINTKTGTGFVFTDYNKDSLLEAVRKALNLYKDKDLWTQLIKNGMSKDCTWKEPVKKYDEIYKKLLKEA